MGLHDDGVRVRPALPSLSNPVSVLFVSMEEVAFFNQNRE